MSLLQIKDLEVRFAASGSGLFGLKKTVGEGGERGVADPRRR